MKRAKVAAIILAAGRSSRMGGLNKLLAPVAGKPMVTHAVDAALEAGAYPVIVVTGHQSEAVLKALGTRHIIPVHNPDYAEGMSTSLRKGVSMLPATVDAAVICLGDMPRVRASHVRRLIAAYDPSEDSVICVSTFGDRRGNPVLIDRHLFEKINKITGDKGARDLIDNREARVRTIAMDDDGILEDVDTPEQLQSADPPKSPA